MLKSLRCSLCVLAVVGTPACLPPDLGGPAVARAEGTKSVTVYAGSESAAKTQAEKDNPGWKAVSAEKTAPEDKNSRQWGVKMEKKK